MHIFKDKKKLKKLKGFSDLMLAFEVEKYNVFKEMSDRLGWDNVYTQDIRYDLIRMVIMDCHIKKGFFTISDLTGVTDLNVRSIERFLSKSVQVGYFEKNPGKDKRVVEYHATEKSTELLKAYLKITKKGAELVNLNFNDTAELSNLSPKELKDFLDWSEDKI